MEIEIISENYNFSYTDIQYEINKIHPKIEMNRKMEMLNIVNEIKNVLKKYNIEYKEKDIYNLINRILFSYFSRTKYSFTDPLFPDITDSDTYNKLLNENIKNIFNTDKEITKDIKIDILFKKAIRNIKKVKINDVNKKSFYIQIRNKRVYFNSLINNIFTYDIPISIYRKLKKDYDKYIMINRHNKDLDMLIYCLLIRYDTLFSRGNQWAMPSRVKKEFNINFELFASSFNHYYDYYCSLFYDIEKYFMSVGYFQNVVFKRGFYMANPPYEVDVLYQMYHIIESSLENTNEKLSFLFGTPLWDKYDFPLHKIIKKSKYYVFSYKIEDKEVNWYDFMKNKYMKIPSNVRYVLSNDKTLDISKIKYVMDTFWTKRI